MSNLAFFIEDRGTSKKLYETHIPISRIERTVLTAASAITALNDPLRGGKL
jgi:hypothetical protein